MAELERVYVRDYFGANSRMDVKYIETLPNQILVFQEGEYILGRSDDGCGLDIDAPIVEVNGKVVIRAYPENAKGADETQVAARGADGHYGGDGVRNRHGGHGGLGSTGQKGFKGGKGQFAERIKIKIGKIVGDGTLHVLNGGCPGGQGSPGGKGGNGGWGGKGSGRACQDWLGRGADSPGDGGNGGQGGEGGIGGDGGDGGDGGAIEYSYSLQPYIDSGKVVLRADGGGRAPGGPGGYGGAGGRWGDGGDGAWCGGGGTAGQSGASRENAQSSGGELGKNGASGLIHCYNAPPHT